MARSRELKVVIAGDAAQLNRAFVKAGKDVDKFGKKTEGMGKKFSAGMKVAGAAAAGALAVGLKESVGAAIEAEKTQARLEAQLKASGTSYKAHAAAIEESIKATSRLSGLDDEDLADSFTNIVRVTGDVNEALRLNALAADFARAKSIDVAKAGELVGKVAGGNIGVLGRYGIKVKEGATAQEALAELQTRFAGQAEAYGKTTAGAADRAAVGFESLQETVGERLAPMLARVANKFADLVDWMSKNEGTVKTVAIAVGSLTAALGGLLLAAKIATAIQTLRKAMLALNLAFLANPVVLITAGIVALGVALVTAYKKSETFRNIVNGAFVAVKKVVVEAVQGIIWIFDKWLGAFSTIATALSKVPLIGDKFKGVARQIDGARAKLRAFSKSLDDVPRIKDIKVNVKMKLPKSLRDILDGKATGSIRAKPPVDLGGDGIGVAPAVSSAGLRGANRALAPLASIGNKLGLRVSSGLRPGAITSSGNVSYHGSGEAVDMAGPPRAMLRYFKALKNFYGPRLAELIYTPGGVGIKNGRPHRYSGKVAQDHYDHVHVALDVGRRGPGIGDGYGKGQIKNLWTRAGGSGAVANLAAAVALAESGGDPNVVSRTGDVGLWQINRATWGRLATKDPMGNARAAVKISSGGRNWRPWVAYTTGAYKRFLSGGGSSPDRSRPSRAAARGTTSRGSSSRPASQVTAGRHGAVTAPPQPSYEQDLADADVAIAEAEAADRQRQIAAQGVRRGVVRERLNKVTKALKSKRLRPATRLRLTQERASLLGELRSIDTTIGELRAPADAAGSGEDPNQALIDATQAWIDAVEAKAEQDRQLAEEAAARERERIESMNALTASLNANTAFADKVSAITSMEAVRLVADVLSNQFGQRIYTRGQMPGTGQLARY